MIRKYIACPYYHLIKCDRLCRYWCQFKQNLKEIMTLCQMGKISKPLSIMVELRHVLLPLSSYLRCHQKGHI